MRKLLNCDELHKKLNENGYICDLSFSQKIFTAINTKPTKGAFLFGPAGVGKTFLPETLSKIMNIDDYYFKQCTSGTKEEDLLMIILPDESTTSSIKIFEAVIIQAAKASKDKSVFLVLDEWDKTRPTADAFLLDFLQSGRINFKGQEITANLENLYVFLTMNDEREISEPLLRRLPKIDFDYMSSNSIKKALKRTHNNEKLIDVCVSLYERSIIGGLSKAATIQELRQFMDAYILLGDNANVNDLVYQYITKTPENHNLLKETEKLTKTDIKKSSENVGIDITKFVPIEAILDKKREKKFKILLKDEDQPIPIRTYDYEKGNGLIKYTKENYDIIIQGYSKNTPEPNSNIIKGDLLTFEVVEEGIEITSPISLVNYKKIHNLWGMEGEVLLIARNIKDEDVYLLKKRGLTITKFGYEDGIVGSYNNIKVFWNNNKIFSVYVDLMDKESFETLFSVGRLPNEDGTRWLSTGEPKGLCYQRADEYISLNKKQPLEIKKEIIKDIKKIESIQLKEGEFLL